MMAITTLGAVPYYKMQIDWNPNLIGMLYQMYRIQVRRNLHYHYADEGDVVFAANYFEGPFSVLSFKANFCSKCRRLLYWDNISTYVQPIEVLDSNA